jgi:hypothetical protein
VRAPVFVGAGSASGKIGDNPLLAVGGLVRNLFPGYYRPTDDEFDQLWEDGVFVFDASVLLNLYRYTDETTTEFLELLEALNGRIWLPHQAALEYQRNRPAVIFKLEDTYDSVRSKIENVAHRIRDDLKGVLQEGRHPRLNRDELQRALQEALEVIQERVGEREEEHPDLLWDDPIRERIEDLFEDRVGPPFGEDELIEIHEEGEKRYEDEVPPGYMDKDKEGASQFGDLVLWKQLLTYAAENQAPIALVTNDQKEDWWREVKGRTIGPRPELVEEIQREADVLFYLYTPDDFLTYARERLAQEVEQDAIDEVRETREEDRAKLEERRQVAANLGFGSLAGVHTRAFREASERMGGLLDQIPDYGTLVQVPDFESGALKARLVPEGMESWAKSIAEFQQYYADLLDQATVDIPEDLGKLYSEGLTPAQDIIKEAAEAKRRHERLARLGRMLEEGEERAGENAEVGEQEEEDDENQGG